jgi:hypothetical protein
MLTQSHRTSVNSRQRIRALVAGSAMWFSVSSATVVFGQSPPALLGSNSVSTGARQASPLSHYGEGYVLLQHGSVMHGFIKPQADCVTIVMDKGNEVTVSKRQILTIGASKEALYKYQTKAIRKWGTGEHWHLAQWCIQNGLLDQAIEHYLELEKQAADNPRFKQLDLQLKQALLQDEQVRKAMLEQGISLPEDAEGLPESRLTDTTPMTGSALTGAQGGVVQAGVVEQAGVVGDRAIAGSVVTAVGRSDQSEPVRLASSYPAHTIPGYVRKSFQTELTPVVVSRCGQSGCHGMLAKNPFQIFQPVGEQAASINERNLERILRYINVQQPAESDLLLYASQAHGTQRNASLNLNREEDRIHLDRIAQWIQSLSRVQSNELKEEGASRVVQAAATGITEGAVHRKDGESLVADRNAKLSKPPKSGGPAVAIDAAELALIEQEIAKLERVPVGKVGSDESASKDPFDAKIFNAKHRGGK